jgi:bleomycin hydrolase
MKKILSFIIAVSFAFYSFAQDTAKTEKSYQFTAVKTIPTTAVKNQAKSGTCWSFSAISFFETEILRLSGREYCLSAMYPVYCAYKAKAERYVRLHGQTNFPTGGAGGDVFWTINNYGMVPEEVYNGLNYGEANHNHSTFEKMLEKSLQIAVSSKTVDTNWRFPFMTTLNGYLGVPPTEFTYKGKKYTPATFAKDLGLNMKDYVHITSLSHHPFYEAKIAIEVPDNWMLHKSHNVPIDEFLQIAQNAIDKGYSFVWGGDVSNDGFNRKTGLAIVPDSIKVTQATRQLAFDTWVTGDDHGMHCVGSAKDQNGDYYFLIKNSWGINRPYNGYFYMSVPYFLMNTLEIDVHKDAIPAAIKTKLGIK